MARRAFRSIINRPSRILGIVLVAVLTMLCTSFESYISSVLSVYEEQIYASAGYRIVITDTAGEDMPEEMVSAVRSLNGVEGLSFQALIDAVPADFENHVEPAEGGTDMPEVSEIRLIGTTDADFSMEFALRYFERTVPREGTLSGNGVLVEEKFAEHNGLKAGDIINIRDPLDGSEVPFEVAGFYRVVRAPEGVYSARGSSFYGQLPYSFIYCSVEQFDRVSPAEVKKNSYNVFCTGREVMQDVLEKISGIISAYDGIKVYDAFESEFALTSVTMYTLRGSSLVIFRIIDLVLYAVLVLMAVLWIKGKFRDFSIYISLGQYRWLIVLESFIEMAMILVFALAVSFLLTLLLRANSTEIMALIIEMSGTGEEFNEAGKNALQTVMSLKDIGISALKIFAVAAAGEVIASLSAVILKFRTLSDME